jgi:hypothetical protein
MTYNKSIYFIIPVPLGEKLMPYTYIYVYVYIYINSSVRLFVYQPVRSKKLKVASLNFQGVEVFIYFSSKMGSSIVVVFRRLVSFQFLTLFKKLFSPFSYTLRNKISNTMLDHWHFENLLLDTRPASWWDLWMLWRLILPPMKISECAFEEDMYVIKMIKES